jgi:DNA-binding beta-propeller fold protein YncE
MRKIGIAAERGTKRISFFDPDTLKVTAQIPIDLSFYDVAVAKGCNLAIAVAGDATFPLVVFDTVGIPTYETTLYGKSRLRDADITPDGRYAIVVDGADINQQMHCFDLVNLVLTDNISSNTQAVAVSPTGNGLILAASNSGADPGTIEIYNISSAGKLTNTNSTVTVPQGPVNITFTPDGKFALVAHFVTNTISILDTSDPANITSPGYTMTSTSGPQTIVISPTNKVFVLTTTAVEIYDFAGNTLVYNPASFAHGLSINPTGFYLGYDQMALDPTTNRLFISANVQNVLGVFTTDGQKVGDSGKVPGITAFGGVAVGIAKELVRGIKLF